jgi:hypothetical protein
VGDGKKEHAHAQGNHGGKDLVQTHGKKAGLQQQGAGVGAEAEKGAMAEGEKSGIAEQQIEADRQQPHDQDFGKNHDPVDRQQERTNEVGAHRQAHAHTPFRNRPVGLNSRMTAKSR